MQHHRTGPDLDRADSKVTQLEREVAALEAVIDRQEKLLARRRLSFLATYHPRSLRPAA